MITDITTIMPDISTMPEPVHISIKNTQFSTMTPSIETSTTTPNKHTEQTPTTIVLTTKTTTTSRTTPTNLPTSTKKQIPITTTTSTLSVTPKRTLSIISNTVKPTERLKNAKESTKINQIRPISQANESYFVPLSIVLVGCGMVICLVGYFVSKYSNKWNRYNSQSIEYKSNYYYSKRMEEPLVDDDAFASNDYINGACIIEDRPHNLANGNVAAAKPSSNINFKPHELAKIRRPTSISIKKHIDQYSDEQCLTEDGDEFIDFLSQSN